MADYCENCIVVWGNVRTLKKIEVEHIDSNFKFNLNTIIPEPRSKEKCDPKYVLDDYTTNEDKERPWFDWYHWRYDNWGCKTNSCHTEVIENFDDDDDDDDGGCLTILFDTAWGGAEKVMQKFISLYKDKAEEIKCLYHMPFYGGALVFEDHEEEFTEEEYDEDFEDEFFDI